MQYNTILSSIDSLKTRTKLIIDRLQMVLRHMSSIVERFFTNFSSIIKILKRCRREIYNLSRKAKYDVWSWSLRYFDLIITNLETKIYISEAKQCVAILLYGFKKLYRQL